MFIPRILNIHTCNKCKKGLIDQNFYRCGIDLKRTRQGKITAFFDYICPDCRHMGQYAVPAKDTDDMPGDMFIQFGRLLNKDFIRQGSTTTIEGMDDFLEEISDD